MSTKTLNLSRRGFLGGAGSLVVYFSLAPRSFAQDEDSGPKLPGSLADNPNLDSWIRIGANGQVTVYTGKVELGQGISTAILQVACEQLRMAPANVTIETADTIEAPNEGYTAGSNSMANSGTAMLHAAAQVRNILRGWAAEDMGVDVDQVEVDNGSVAGPGGQSIGFGELVSGRSLEIEAKPQSDLLDPSEHRIMGQSLPRLDIPPKVTGGEAYLHDIRMDGMGHARVVRPPSYGATLQDVDTSAAESVPGVVKIVRDGNYLAVVAEREYEAVLAMRALSEGATWNEPGGLPDQATIFEHIRSMQSEDTVVDKRGNGQMPGGDDLIEAEYTRPYTMHGAIGPSCAVAHMDGDTMKIWTHSQGVYPLRATLVKLLSMPAERIQLTHIDGSGCYGHNGADDVAADAALIARAVPGRPVRVLWMREDEHGWEPFGTAMISRARGKLGSDGKIEGWGYEVWSMPHATRPGGSPDNLMPAWHIANSYGPPKGFNIPPPSGGVERNAIPTYDLPNTHIVEHYIPEMPVRVSALRSLGGYMNVFSVESFTDEMAIAAEADPVEFRLRHVSDERARDVITMAAKEFGWDDAANLPRNRGRGFAYARYETTDAYTAVALEIEVEPATGRIRVVRAVAADDSGDAVNPDGIKNQIEGGIIQSTSWTLYEEVTFDDTRITTRDWGSYPILRFDAVPDSIEVHVINRPGEPFLGTGEAAQGPTAAAIANALFDATGLRLRNLPFRPDRVREALAEAPLDDAA